MIRTLLMLSAAFGVSLAPLPAASAPTPLLLLPDDIQFLGKSNLHNMWSDEGESYIELPGGRTAVPLTLIDVPAAADYDVWTRTNVYRTQAPQPTYRIVIDTHPAEKLSGLGDTKGWKWEKVGRVSLTQGQHVVSFQSGEPWAHAGAVLLTRSDVDPTQLPLSQLLSYRVTPPEVPTPEAEPLAAEPQGGPGQEVASIESATTRLVFTEGRDATGKPRILRSVFTRENNEWKPVPFNSAAETLQLIYSPKATLNTKTFIPSWAEAKPFDFTLDGTVYHAADETNPFEVGTVVSLRPASAHLAAPDRVTVQYTGEGGLDATGTWSLDGNVEKFEVTLTAPKAGFYSFAFSPFQAWKKDSIQSVQLPPLFQKQRLPSTPVTINSSASPQAMALVQAEPGENAGSFVYIAAADPAAMPFVWSDRDNSPYAFGLLNSGFHVQPTAFSPVLGLAGSKIEAGATLRASFGALVLRGDWKNGIAAGYNQIFKVRDYREPTVSLTAAALNMIDLLKDNDHSGWSDRLKGPYNIESYQTASQASPLTYFSVAMLTRDEDFYRRRALAALEFTLSRKSPHYSNSLPTTSATSYVSPAEMRLAYPGGSFGATYWEGVSEMTQNLNPWIGALALKNGKPALSAAHFIPPWTELLGVYRLHPTPQGLQEVEAACDDWLKSDVYGKKSQFLGEMPFYNFGSYPYWWPLLDLYDITGEARYLEAAREGAYYTVAGLWTHPSIPDRKVTINPGGTYPQLEFNFWKGREKFRLGLPRTPNDTPEHQADAWQVAELGLGLEQPWTLYLGKAGVRHIMNSAWAPSLLRLYKDTSDPLFLTTARNAIVGRFANYPGYYIDGLNDIMMNPRYPLQGPDITDIYYHHIPTHLAFTLDYLFTEAEQVSGGQIAFPWVRQQGYVWFTSREYGARPGKIYNDTGMRPWLSRTAFAIDEPQFNYFGALGQGRFDVVVVNSSKSPAGGHLAIDPGQTGVAAGTSYEILVNGTVTETGKTGARLAFTLPANTAAVFRFPTTKADELPAASPLQAEPVSLPMPDKKGTVYAFRIRSPFGKDSLYAFVGGEIAPGTVVSLTREGESGPAPTCSDPPYEFTIYPVPQDKDAVFSLTIQPPNGPASQVGPFTLAGDRGH